MPTQFTTVDIANNLAVQPEHVLQIIEALTQFGQTYSTVEFYRQGKTNFGAATFQSNAHVEMNYYAGRNPLTVYSGLVNDVTALEVDVDGQTYIHDIRTTNLSGSQLGVNGPATIAVDTDSFSVSTQYNAATVNMVNVDTATINLGDYQEAENGTKIYIDDQAELIGLKADGGIWVTGSIYGNLTGSATNATSASHAINANTASFVRNAISASFLPIGTYAITSSWANNANTANNSTYATYATFVTSLNSIVIPSISSGSTWAAVNTGSAVFQVQSSSLTPLTVQPSKIGINKTVPTGALHITTGSTTFNNTNPLGLDSHIVLENPYFGGQTVISSIINGNLTGKIRNDFGGGMTYVSSGSSSGTSGNYHAFYTSGDYPGGSAKMVIWATGNVWIGDNGPAAAIPDTGYKLFVSGTGNFVNDLTVTGSINILSASLSGSVVTNVGDTYSSYKPVQNIVTLSSAEYQALAAANNAVSGTLYIVLQ